MGTSEAVQVGKAMVDEVLVNGPRASLAYMASRQPQPGQNYSAYAVEQKKEGQPSMWPAPPVGGYAGAFYGAQAFDPQHYAMQQQMWHQQQQQAYHAQMQALQAQGAAAPACEWSEHDMGNGTKYYYNSQTGTSQWEKPAALT